MSEAGLERKLTQEVEHRGGLALKFVSPGWRGAPDRLVLMPQGRVWFVEMKAPGRKPRPLQEYRLRILREMGFQARVVSTEDELQQFLAEVDKCDL